MFLFDLFRSFLPLHNPIGFGSADFIEFALAAMLVLMVALHAVSYTHLDVYKRQLAALYESWTIPLAVLLAVPLGLFGAVLAVWMRDYPYDMYTQIGIVTLIGLAAKNAILIVEYARMSHEEGMSIVDAALEAARLRLRPILMTSFAFILGVVPLALAVGAGAASRRSLGTAVFGGMNAATLLAVFIVPVLYVVIQRAGERGKS